MPRISGTISSETVHALPAGTSDPRLPPTRARRDVLHVHLLAARLPRPHHPAARLLLPAADHPVLCMADELPPSAGGRQPGFPPGDRKSTRLNSSHLGIS